MSAGIEDEFKILKERLEKVSGGEREEILGVLDAIDKRKDSMTLALLKSTRVGVPVGKLTKHSDPDVSQKAKEIIAVWKKLTSTSKTSNSAKTSSNSAKTSTTSESSSKAIKRQSETSSTTASPAAKRTKSSEKLAPVTPQQPKTSDKSEAIRNKLRSYVERALKKEKPKEGETFLYTAEEAAQCIEQAVLDKHNGIVDEDYIAHMRMLFLNFDNDKRSDLRHEILDTEDVRRWANYSSEELMSSEQRKELQKNHDDFLRTLKGVDPLANVTEGINQCNRCGSHRIATYQLQTRGADEPMTIFYTCADCKKRWRG